MAKTKITLYFDMDGTIADLYGVSGWLNDLDAFRTRPYDEAKCMHNMSALARAIHRAQSRGYRVGIISWLPRVVRSPITRRSREQNSNGSKHISNPSTLTRYTLCATAPPKARLRLMMAYSLTMKSVIEKNGIGARHIRPI